MENSKENSIYISDDESENGLPGTRTNPHFVDSDSSPSSSTSNPSHGRPSPGLSSSPSLSTSDSSSNPFRQADLREGVYADYKKLIDTKSSIEEKIKEIKDSVPYFHSIEVSDPIFDFFVHCHEYARAFFPYTEHRVNFFEEELIGIKNNLKEKFEVLIDFIKNKQKETKQLIEDLELLDFIKDYEKTYKALLQNIKDGSFMTFSSFLSEDNLNRDLKEFLSAVEEVPYENELIVFQHLLDTFVRTVSNDADYLQFCLSDLIQDSYLISHKELTNDYKNRIRQRLEERPQQQQRREQQRREQQRRERREQREQERQEGAKKSRGGGGGTIGKFYSLGIY